MLLLLSKGCLFSCSPSRYPLQGMRECWDRHFYFRIGFGVEIRFFTPIGQKQKFDDTLTSPKN